MTDQRVDLVGLGARVHLFIQPTVREPFTTFFRDVLACDVVELDFGLSHPILLVRFQDGSAFSVEITELAPSQDSEARDDEHAFRGAWIEFRSPDVEAVHAALRAAGIPEFRHPGSKHIYFSAPGGQVFRVLDVDYVGP
jgi:hypothetical protein